MPFTKYLLFERETLAFYRSVNRELETLKFKTLILYPNHNNYDTGVGLPRWSISFS